MKQAVSLFLITSLLVSCVGSLVSPTKWTETLAPASVVHTMTETLTPPASASAARTSTPVLPTPLHTASPFPTSAPDARLKRQCLEIASTLPADAEVSGLIGLGGRDLDYLLDVKSGHKIILSKKGTSIEHNVSPHGNWLAYKDVDSDQQGTPDPSQLVVTAADGQPRQIIPWEDSWRFLSTWLDDEHLLLSRERGEGKNDSLIVLNPFTSEQHLELLPDYPGIYTYDPEPHWQRFNKSKTVYDATLSRVVYPVFTHSLEQLILWDRQAGLPITVISGTISFGVTPQWSLDGQRFIISGPSTLLSSRPQPDPFFEHQELYSVSRSGEIVRLTYLTDEYSSVRFSEYVWSPDGRYIAFRLDGPESYPDIYSTAPPQMGGRWVVMDMVTQKITDYCLPGGLSVVAPVWSPDSRQIVVEDYYQSTPPFRSNVYLIDITQNFAVKIAEDVTPFGWMKSSP